MNQDWQIQQLTKQVELLSKIVLLQASMIKDVYNALDDHNMGGPHYTDGHKLTDLTESLEILAREIEPLSAEDRKVVSNAKATMRNLPSTVSCYKCGQTVPIGKAESRWRWTTKDGRQLFTDQEPQEGGAWDGSEKEQVELCSKCAHPFYR